MKIDINNRIIEKIGRINLGLLNFTAVVKKSDDTLWTNISAECQTKCEQYQLEDIQKINHIAASRTAYKKCGNDPNRYRPSADSLLRRIVKGNELYKVNNVVDVLNLCSIRTGFSIGGYDTDKIDGGIFLDTGVTDDIYSGIGRGKLNISDLPVLRDLQGPFGTPTSDSERTMITEASNNILFIFFDFACSEDLTSTLNNCMELLERYCNARNIENTILKF